MPKFQEPPVTLADPALVEKATQLLKSAKRPLVIVGKGKAGGEVTQKSTYPAFNGQMCGALLQW